MEKEIMLRPEVAIREATVEDTEAVRRVQAASWLATYPNEEFGVPYDWVKERTERWLTPEKLEQSKVRIEQSLNDPQGYYRLAEINGEVVGFVHGSSKEDKTKKLEAIYVRPDVIGTGVGGRLMDGFMEWAGEGEIELEVAVYNERAIGFYSRYGFSPVEGTEYLYEDIMPVMVMRKEARSEV